MPPARAHRLLPGLLLPGLLTGLLLTGLLLTACDPTPAPPPPPSPDPVLAWVDDLPLRRSALEAPASARDDERRAVLEAAIDQALLARLARSLPPYAALAPADAARAFEADHFAPARFCAALSEESLLTHFHRHRPRYVHPDYHVVQALRASCCAPDAPGPCAGCPHDPLELADDLDTRLSRRLLDGLRESPDAADAVAALWGVTARELGLAPESATWTLFHDPARPAAFKPDAAPPEDWPSVLSLPQGARTPVWADSQGVRAYVKLEVVAAASGGLADPLVRHDVWARACAEHVARGRARLAQDLRAGATIRYAE